MEIGVKLRPSGTITDADPGHMGMFWRHAEELSFRGFRFYVDDLPQEYQDVAKWREYLFENCVPGYIFDDTCIRDDYSRRREVLVCKSWNAKGELADVVEEITTPRQFGLYSFNPDSFDRHNCVTWAVETVNSVVGSVLPRVREGRIKLMKDAIKAVQ